MKIANPIYDVVFKSMMEDDTIAKAILSAILQVEIVSLEIKPQELITVTHRFQSHCQNGARQFSKHFD